MSRGLAAGTEVVRRRDQALPEMVLPDAIDHYPSRKRIVRIGDPVGQIIAPAAFVIGRQLLTPEDSEESAWDFLAQVPGVALTMYASVGGKALHNRISLVDFGRVLAQFGDARSDLNSLRRNFFGHPR